MTTGRLLVNSGTFAAMTSHGDIHGTRGTSTDGLFIRDARHLSRWLLTADGAAPTLLTSSEDGCVLTPAGTRDHPPAYTLFREQAVAPGALTEHIRLVSNRGAPTVVEVELQVDADFADQFELRADHRTYEKPGAHRTAHNTPNGVAFHYRRGETWSSRTAVTASPPPHRTRPADEDGTARVLIWRLALPAHGTADLALTARAVPHGAPEPPLPGAPATVRNRQEADTGGFVHARPRPRDLTSWEELARACEQGLADLAKLRIPFAGPGGEALRVPAAGVPWFLSLFGRDSLLTSLFALPYRPGPAADTLLALAATQGTRNDPARLEQPGRIVHEVRYGELAHFGQVPYGRYYGSVDATPLFLVLLEAHAAVTGDPALARRLEPQARAAVEWMFRDGGLGENGYLRYTSDAPHGGLANQNWKDSPGAVCFSDGHQAEGALAVSEVQGYAYDALVRTARLARTVWEDPREADRLDETAADLRTRFRRDFWMPAQAFPALALDGRDRQVDALASDAGHLLWSGILGPEEEQAVGHRLLRPDFFSGFGIRTLAAGQAPYHPLSYHRGSIWPHDNAVIVLGLARCGLVEQAGAVARGLIRAAALHDWRLPEVMAGYGRDDHPAPVPYPHSSSPQAWAAATPLALLTALRETATASADPSGDVGDTRRHTDGHRESAAR
ncbi:glycogen debranching N-terminal domain-containing protein [Streptosporangium sp. 'caverna']|uniref:amylo-alpha-1,6-glucosidase n=1 Tax=Streptosporangium sp. 'caverna' TaxID=2202249 RepID=UPI000D7E9419|nr:glycogen debranching N-terminal domain-containing protein [Streptosporangium sp. 'caverna']AWS44899.1 aminotransferase [Streptosporangium sp. 'caverna']